jgi:hypothetical protein
MRLAWMLVICLLVAGIAASVILYPLGQGSESSHPPTESSDSATESSHPPTESSRPVTYYVDAGRGQNSNPGTSPDAPWRTLSRLTAVDLRGGDAIRLRGGESDTGVVRLSRENLSETSRKAMLTIGSYGGGRATLLAPVGQDAIAATDVAGIRVRGVDLVGRRPVCRIDARTGYRYGATGIAVRADHPGVALEQGISIDDVDVSGFCNGIAVGSGVEGSRISHLRVTAVEAHDNASAGIWTYDPAVRQHTIEDVRVSRARAYRNGAFGGIVLFGVDGGTVRRSVAYANARATEGGVGIWAFDSTRILFAHNESYANGSLTIHHDGDGFDFDRGVSNSVMVRNYSHDNGGAGFLVCSCNADHDPYYRMHNDVIRSNISRNDGSSGQPSFWVYGGELMTGLEIADNRVVSAAGDGPLVEIIGCLLCDRGWRAWYVADLSSGQPYTEVRLSGNTFMAGAGKTPLEKHGGPRDIFYLHDNVWRSDG